jgi:hypothetical protein
LAGPEKRLPGQSNEDFGKSKDPNSDFIGTQSLYGGGDPGWMIRAMRAVSDWRDRRRDKGTGQPSA